MITEEQAIAPFPPPPGGWRCFHCGAKLRTVAEGEAHFGPVPSAKPACIIKGEIGLVVALRAAERQHDEMEVRLIAARLKLDRAGEDDAVERFRATRAANLGIESSLSPADK